MQLFYQLYTGSIVHNNREPSSNERIGIVNDNVINRQEEALNRSGNHVRRGACAISRSGDSLWSSYGAVAPNSTPSSERVCEHHETRGEKQTKELLDKASVKSTTHFVINNKT